jgi:nucleotide-binding universal stress UspA family protein
MRILWATDGSPAAEAATAYLRGPLNSPDHTVVVAAVAPAPLLSDARPDPSMLLWRLVPDYRERTSEAVTELVVREAEQLNGIRAEVTTAVRLGSAPTALLDLVESEAIDLVIMGAHGHSAARELLLGSVSRQVATNARCSVLVVRRRRRPRNVLVAYDGSRDADAAVDLVASLEPDNMSATALHIFEPPSLSSVQAERLGIRLEDAHQEHRARGRALVNAAARGLRSAGWTVSARTREGRPARSIVDAARELSADLVAVGARGSHSAEGSEHRAAGLAQQVLEHAPCSVLIARSP